MKAPWRWCATAGFALCTFASTVVASELVVDRVGATSQGYVFVDYRLDEPFVGKSLDAIRSGLPSTLTFTVEVWRQRAGWWDRLEETREARVRVLRDLLNDQYVAASPEEVRRFPDLESLTQAVCAHRREYLRPESPSKTYYVVVSANLAPLSVEDLRELEDWLQGSLRSGEEASPGRVAGLSGTMVGLLMSVTGFGDETVQMRSESFIPNAVRPPPQPAGTHLASPDSSQQRGSHPQE